MAEEHEIYKIMADRNFVISFGGGFIENEKADIDCKFIHACDLNSITQIKNKFFRDQRTVIIQLNKKQIELEGFKVIYESNNEGGQKYWHIYRPIDKPNQLLSIKCMI